MDLLKKRIQVACGQIPADLVIKNGRIVNVFTKEIMEGDIALSDGRIAGIGSYTGKEVYDAAGNYIVPGLIDGHMHIESTMMIPSELAKVLIQHGVTTVMADPHEIANVAGKEGIQYMLDSSEGLCVDMFFLIPSCVPATEFESSGACLEAGDIKSFYSNRRVLGLAEVMNYPAIEQLEESILSKIFCSEGKIIDGHAAGLSGKKLNAYATAGIYSDHECDTVEEARERLALGMYLMIREGTAAKNLKKLLPAVNSENSRRCIFVTDDKLPDDLVQDGNVDHNIRLAIQEGMDPLTAIQMATINTAEFFRLDQTGGIAPGYHADLVIVEDLTAFKIKDVFKNGCLQTNDQSANRQMKDSTPHSRQLFQMQIADLCADSFQMPLNDNRCNIIEMIPNSLVTRHIIETVTNQNGHFVPSVVKDQLKLAVIERHHATGNIGLGIIKGFGIKNGAIASSVSHDSHNIIAVGTNDQDMLTAVERIRQLNGGMIVVQEGQILAEIALPIGGIMSDQRYEQLTAQMPLLHSALSTIECRTDFNPFLTLSFQALPVIPELKLTDQGLFSFASFSHISYQA